MKIDEGYIDSIIGDGTTEMTKYTGEEWQIRQALRNEQRGRAERILLTLKTLEEQIDAEQ